MGWVVKTGEVSTEWELTTVTRTDRTPTGEAPLAGGRVASRQRLHEAAVVTHQVRGNNPRQHRYTTQRSQRCFLPLKPAATRYTYYVAQPLVRVLFAVVLGPQVAALRMLY